MENLDKQSIEQVPIYYIRKKNIEKKQLPVSLSPLNVTILQRFKNKATLPRIALKPINIRWIRTGSD